MVTDTISGELATVTGKLVFVTGKLVIISGVLVEDRFGESLDMVSSWSPGDLVVKFGVTDTTSSELVTVTGKLVFVTGELVIISGVLVEDRFGEYTISSDSPEWSSTNTREMITSLPVTVASLPEVVSVDPNSTTRSPGHQLDTISSDSPERSSTNTPGMITSFQ